MMILFASMSYIAYIHALYVQQRSSSHHLPFSIHLSVSSHSSAPLALSPLTRSGLPDGDNSSEAYHFVLQGS